MKTTAIKEIPCRKDCGRTFPSEKSERMHYHRKHSKSIRTLGQQGLGLARSAALAAKTPPARLILKDNSIKLNGKIKPSHGAKTVEVIVNVCPRCGLKMQHLAKILLKAGFTHPVINACPCGVNIKRVAAAMADHT